MLRTSLKDKELLPLKNRILSAINEYRMTYPWRARATNRLNDTNNIANICHKAQTKEMLLQDLVDYFSSDAFYTGASDSSALETLIVENIFAADAETRDGKTAFSSYKPMPHPSKQTTPNGATDSITSLKYDLNDFMQYYIDKYIAEKNGAIEEYRQTNIREIKNILNDANRSDRGKAVEIKSYVQSIAFTHSFFKSSTLKNYILTALENFSQYSTRNVATRIWETSNPTTPSKIMLFLHGWHDSLNSGDQLALEAVKQGFKVIAYDHRGHGCDTQREESGISTDLLRIDFRKFLQHTQENNPHAEFALVGHSMGGAILTTENKFINENSSIKSISLLAPAVSSGLKMIDPAKILYRNMHANVKAAQHASDRFGGAGPTFLGLFDLMKKAAQALKQIFTNLADQTKWRIYSGKKDLSVNYTEFQFIPDKHIAFFSRGDHALQFGHRASTVNQQVLRDIGEHFNDSVAKNEKIELLHPPH